MQKEVVAFGLSVTQKIPVSLNISISEGGGRWEKLLYKYNAYYYKNIIIIFNYIRNIYL